MVKKQHKALGDRGGISAKLQKDFEQAIHLADNGKVEGNKELTMAIPCMYGLSFLLDDGLMIIHLHLLGRSMGGFE
jgi:N-acetylneuraminic acid mutarotase